MEDRILALRLCAGDDGALAEIFDRHGGLVLGLARRVTGSESTAEDIVQEVFTSLWTRPQQFDPDRGSLRSFLGTMTHRKAVDTVRSTVRRKAREERAEEPWVTVPDPMEPAAEAHLVRAAIERLPEEQRRAVELTFWNGMTNREVAECLGHP